MKIPKQPPPPGHIRSTLHSSSPYLTATPESHRRRVTHHDRGNPNLDPEEDLSKNREFYRVQDVRPPYTYAALIRQVGEDGDGWTGGRMRMEIKMAFITTFMIYFSTFWWSWLCWDRWCSHPDPGYSGGPLPAVDSPRHLQLVHNNILLLQAERCQLEGKAENSLDVCFNFTYRISPLSATLLFLSCSPSIGAINRQTLYNILHSLLSLNFCHRIVNPQMYLNKLTQCSPQIH